MRYLFFLTVCSQIVFGAQVVLPGSSSKEGLKFSSVLQHTPIVQEALLLLDTPQVNAVIDKIVLNGFRVAGYLIEKLKEDVNSKLTINDCDKQFKGPYAIAVQAFQDSVLREKTARALLMQNFDKFPEFKFAVEALSLEDFLSARLQLSNVWPFAARLLVELKSYKGKNGVSYKFNEVTGDPIDSLVFDKDLDEHVKNDVKSLIKTCLVSLSSHFVENWAVNLKEYKQETDSRKLSFCLNADKRLLSVDDLVNLQIDARTGPFVCSDKDVDETPVVVTEVVPESSSWLWLLLIVLLVFATVGIIRHRKKTNSFTGAYSSKLAIHDYEKI